MLQIKIHGQLRVGSNYLHQLLLRNFRVDSLSAEDGGWKHGPFIADPNLCYLVICRDPYAWAPSFLHWERTHGRTRASSLEQFLSQPVSHPGLRSAWSATDPVDVWNKAYSHWVNDGKTKATVVRYESLLSDFSGEMEKLELLFELQRLNPSLRNVHRRADDWPIPGKRRPLDLEYYRQRQYLQDHSRESLQLMDERLDCELLTKIGYKLVKQG